jgi:hypothetical protein
MLNVQIRPHFQAPLKLLRDGQSDGKNRALATAFALRVNPATVHLNNRLTEGEAETFAPFFELRT